MEHIFKFKFPLKMMSPVAIDKGYTERFLDGKRESDAALKIRTAFDHVAEGKDIMIIEGTGHAGVGSVFDLSNAAVAKMLDSSVILVSQGGIGNPIDEIMLNKSVFDKMGVKMIGVVVNKVLPEKYEKVNKYVRMGLARLGVPVLGVMPYMKTLDIPTMHDIKEDLDMQVLCGEKFLDTQMKRVLVGAMESRSVMNYLEDDCLVITPGNRIDLINLLIKAHTGRFCAPKRIAGIVLSGGMLPKRRTYNALKKTNIPTLVSALNTYDVSSKIHDLTVKIKFRDKNKVSMVMNMIGKYVDIDRILREL